MSVTQFVVSTTILIACIVLLVIISCQISDLDLVVRGGASLSAVGAVLVIFQVIREAKYENDNAVDKENVRKDNMSPLDRDIVETTINRRVKDRYKQRMRIICFIAIVIFVGESLNGWGDIVFGKIVNQRWFGLFEQFSDCG